VRRLTIVTGSLPPDVCGCGDYIHSLSIELERKGVIADIFLRRKWRLRYVWKYLVDIRETPAKIVNIQYPTQGYGWSILPQILSVLLFNRYRVITLHEFSQKRIEAKISIYLFFLSADWIIFTTNREFEAACRIAPWVASMSSVVPIGSNIPFHDAQSPDTDITYFGLIHPSKGLETFVSILSSLSNRQRLRIRAIGQVLPGYESYAAKILPQLEQLGIDVVLNRSAEDVSEMLSRSRIAFLPFPDGMSRRRGSALAAMGNGALLVTTTAMQDNDIYSSICAMPTTELDMTQLLKDALANYDSYHSIRAAGQEFARSISWSNVADEYIKIIDKVAEGNVRAE